jgi:predicted acetyltransferase
MVKLRKFEFFSHSGRNEELLDFVNRTRASYSFSRRVYSESEMQNVYLIMVGQSVLGFCEVEIQNICLEAPRMTVLNLHELHIVEAARRKGVARATITHLMRLKLPIELFVANENVPMVNLINWFGAEMKSAPENVKSFIIFSRAYGHNS